LSDAASTAKAQVATVADASMHEAKAVAKDAKAHTQEVLSQSRDQLRQQADDQFRNFAGTLSDIGRQLNNMVQGRPESGLVVDVTNDIAASVARFGERVDRGGVDGTLQDVKRFARKRPGAFLLASLGGGVMVGRLLRTSDHHALVDAAKPTSDKSDDELPPTLPLVAGPQGT
jgi:hypothetical protein